MQTSPGFSYSMSFLCDYFFARMSRCSPTNTIPASLFQLSSTASSYNSGYRWNEQKIPLYNSQSSLSSLQQCFPTFFPRIFVPFTSFYHTLHRLLCVRVDLTQQVSFSDLTDFADTSSIEISRWWRRWSTAYYSEIKWNSNSKTLRNRKITPMLPHSVSLRSSMIFVTFLTNSGHYL